MPRGKILNSLEQGQILAYHDQGLSVRKIANKIGRGSTVVQNYLTLKSKYGTKKRNPKRSKINNRTKRRMIHLASNTGRTANDIKVELQLPLSTRRVQQILKYDGKLQHLNRVHQTNLTQRHKKARFLFAEKYQDEWEDEWQNVIFSDEKKFNLDGPDGNQKYWHDPRKKPLARKTRNFGGGSLMVWGGFAFNGRTPICFISGRMNAEMYTELLEDVLVTHGEDIAGPEYVFQQDNAAVHTAKVTKHFFADHKIPVLDWPAISPDLNPVENVWGLLSDAIYKNNRQFDTVRELKKCVQEEWAKIDVQVLQKLVQSMPRRLQHVIIKKGDHISY